MWRNRCLHRLDDQFLIVIHYLICRGPFCYRGGWYGFSQEEDVSSFSRQHGVSFNFNYYLIEAIHPLAGFGLNIVTLLLVLLFKLHQIHHGIKVDLWLQNMKGSSINSLAPGRCGSNLKGVITEHCYRLSFWTPVNCSQGKPQDTFNDKLN